MSRYVNNGRDLLGAFPYSLARDDDKEKLAESIAGDLAGIVADTAKAVIFPNIDILPEALLDTLAQDLKIDWYDTDSPVEYKRNTVKECILVHKYKGTKYAVETALHSMFASAEVQEWFEYSGEPFHFKVVVYGSTSSGLKKLNSKLMYAKNLRSVLDMVEFVLTPTPIEVFFGGAVAGVSKSVGAQIVSDNDDIFAAVGELFGGGVGGGYSKTIGAEVESAEDEIFTAVGYAYGGGAAVGYTKTISAAPILA